MVTRKDGKVVMSWQELSEALSKAGVLMGDEDILNLTLTKPRTVEVMTIRVDRSKESDE